MVRAWTLVAPRLTLKVKVKGQGHEVQKGNFKSHFSQTYNVFMVTWPRLRLTLKLTSKVKVIGQRSK